jgi:anti-anti-sigma regulatory factor
VWFVDLAGVRVLLDAAARARETGARLTITNCPPIVSRMLALLRLEHAVDIKTTARLTAGAPCRLGPARRRASAAELD